MNPRIIKVNPLSDFKLMLNFSNGEIKKFDVKPYLNFGVFQELKDEAIFKMVKVQFGTVVWNNEIDFCPDTLYLESVKI